MSLVSSRVALRHRTSIQRDTAAGTIDAGGQSAPPYWQTITSGLPCRAWTNVAREPSDAGKSFVVEDRQVVVPLGTDVTEADQLGDILDRAGMVLFKGPMNILGVLAYPDHLELSLEVVR